MLISIDVQRIHIFYEYMIDVQVVVETRIINQNDIKRQTKFLLSALDWVRVSVAKENFSNDA